MVCPQVVAAHSGSGSAAMSVVGDTNVVPTMGTAGPQPVGWPGPAHPSKRTRLETSKPVPVTVSEMVAFAAPDDGLTAVRVELALATCRVRTFEARFPSFTTQIS